MKQVSVFMDVEDPINPLADDAALDFPALFEAVGIRGSFCLTGEKCRTLMARARLDVRDAYLPHGLGLHTNTHSYHPSTMELLADLDFNEGCEAVYAAEKPGLEAFQALTGSAPAFWGGAGNTWSPEITDSLKRLGIPAYSYALTALPDEAVHRFNGVIALPQAMSISEAEWAEDAKASAAKERVFKGLETIPQPWIGIFVGHPTKFRHVDYWDAAYYAGHTPPSPVLTPTVTDHTFERAKRNLAAFLAELAKRAQVIGVDDYLATQPTFRPPTAAEQEFFKEASAKNIRSAIGWPIHRPGLSPEKIVAKTLALAHTLESASG